MAEDNTLPAEGASSTQAPPAASGAPLPPEAVPQAAGGEASPPVLQNVPPDLSAPVESQQLIPSTGVPLAPPGSDMSVKDMFLHADPVVQGVMLLLLAASVATWVIIFEKFFILKKVSRSVMLFKKAAADDARPLAEETFPPLTRDLAKAGLAESRDLAGGEPRCEYRERVERSMRAELSGLMDRVGYRTMFLATVGAVSPFVGLFGTVWGIMHSFVGIASSGETTLAVVAPGIAEALFATAMGLVAAIPAVIAYNKISGTMKKITKEALTAIGFLGNRLARRRFGES